MRRRTARWRTQVVAVRTEDREHNESKHSHSDRERKLLAEQPTQAIQPNTSRTELRARLERTHAERVRAVRHSPPVCSTIDRQQAHLDVAAAAPPSAARSGSVATLRCAPTGSRLLRHSAQPTHKRPSYVVNLCCAAQRTEEHTATAAGQSCFPLVGVSHHPYIVDDREVIDPGCSLIINARHALHLTRVPLLLHSIPVPVSVSTQSSPLLARGHSHPP